MLQIRRVYADDGRRLTPLRHSEVKHQLCSRPSNKTGPKTAAPAASNRAASSDPSLLMQVIAVAPSMMNQSWCLPRYVHSWATEMQPSMLHQPLKWRASDTGQSSTCHEWEVLLWLFALRSAGLLLSLSAPMPNRSTPHTDHG